jgi:hypothetical protein
MKRLGAGSSGCASTKRSPSRLGDLDADNLRLRGKQTRNAEAVATIKVRAE